MVHAKTRGKAIAYIMNKIDPGYGFIHFHAIRLSGLDDKKITYDNAVKAGFFYYDAFSGKPIPRPASIRAFVNDCTCRICKAKENFEREWQEKINSRCPKVEL